MTLLDYLKVICRKWWVLLLAIVIACACCTGVTLADKSQYYRASIVMNMSPDGALGQPNPGSPTLQFIQEMIEDEAFVAWDTVKFRTAVIEELEKISPAISTQVDESVLANSIGFKKLNGTNFMIYVDHENEEIATTILDAVDNIASDYFKQTSSMNECVIVSPIDVPVVSLVTAKDRLPINMIISFMAGIVIGLIIILVLDLIRPTLIDNQRVEQTVGVAVLGQVNVSEVVKNEKQ